MADSLHVGVCGVIVAAVVERCNRKRNHRIWVRDWIRNRPAHGAYHHLLQELQTANGSDFKHFIRMDVASFKFLLAKVAPTITKQDTCMSKAISAGERLALTLIFLATGNMIKYNYVNY